MNTLLYLKWITNKDLLYGTLPSAMCQPGWEEGLEENESESESRSVVSNSLPPHGL